MTSPLLDPLIIALASFLTAIIAIPLVRKASLRGGFVDRPGGRKRHDDEVPPVGGLVIAPLFLLMATLAGLSPLEHWPLYLALALVAAAGAYDDARELRPSAKFLVQILAAALIVWPGGANIRSMGYLLGDAEILLHAAGPFFTVICVTLMINAMNMIDGLDGLAGGLAAIAIFWFAVACYHAQAWSELGQLCALGGALAGFLAYNMRHPLRRRASVFLGDSGSMTLGLLLAWYAITLSQKPAPVVTDAISVAWILALPVIDAFSLVVGRIARGKHPFEADRRHFHHYFARAGVADGKTVVILLTLALISGFAGYAGYRMRVPDRYMFGGWVCLLALHTAIAFRSQHFIALLKKLDRKK